MFLLLGESIPVTKTPLPNIDNSIPWMAHSGDDYRRHVLFCGTEVIQTKGNGQDLVKAVVLQTGMLYMSYCCIILYIYMCSS